LPLDRLSRFIGKRHRVALDPVQKNRIGGIILSALFGNAAVIETTISINAAQKTYIGTQIPGHFKIGKAVKVRLLRHNEFVKAESPIAISRIPYRRQ
jgi:hypothetical protein